MSLFSPHCRLLLAVAALSASFSSQASPYVFRQPVVGLHSTTTATGADTGSGTSAPAPARADFVLVGSPAPAQTFPTTLVGRAASPDIAVSMRNAGDALGSLVVPAFTGDNASDFSAFGCTNVAAGATCAVTVRFTPSAAGVRSAALSLAGTSLSFTGQGVLPVAVFTLEGSQNTAQSFPTTAVGSTASSTASVALRNTGSATGSLTIPAFQGANPNDFSASGCANVAVNALCAVTVSFSPQSSGDKSAQLTLGGSVFTFSAVAAAYGDGLFTTPGSYYWVAPAGVTSVSVVAIGGGGGWQGNPGGGGGGLGWRNNIAVTPGAQYLVVVGAGGGSVPGTNGKDSYFSSTSIVKGGGGTAGGAAGVPGAGGNYVGTGGGYGGAGGNASSGQGGGGGGAGGYSGPGGKGGAFNTAGSAGQGGGGGGGGGGTSGYAGGLGGGVDVYGIGASGAGGAAGISLSGQNGSYVSGAYGSGTGAGGARGGAVRIIWGPNRSFPSNAQ